MYPIIAQTLSGGLRGQFMIYKWLWRWSDSSQNFYFAKLETVSLWFYNKHKIFDSLRLHIYIVLFCDQLILVPGHKIVQCKYAIYGYKKFYETSEIITKLSLILQNKNFANCLTTSFGKLSVGSVGFSVGLTSLHWEKFWFFVFELSYISRILKKYHKNK